MACVTVTNVTVLDNPARFENPFQVSATTAASRQLRAPGPLHSTTTAIPFAPPPQTPPTPTHRRLVPPTQFEIEFECIAPIPDDIEWKLTCAASSLHPCTGPPWAPSLASLPPARPHHASASLATRSASPNPALTLP